jgi:D-alanine-D-alanine ligase
MESKQRFAIFGGPSPEHDVSILTGLQAAKVSGLGLIYWAKDGEFYLLEGEPEAEDFLNKIPGDYKRLKIVLGNEPGFYVQKRSGKLSKLQVDVILNCCHGGPGEDGRLPAILEVAKIKYSGPDPELSVLGMDKYLFYAAVKSLGLPLLRRCLVENVDFDGPYIVKPRFGGSSIGIEIAEDLKTAADLIKTARFYKKGAVIEPYRPDLSDLQISARNYPEFQMTRIEKPLKASDTNPILGYKDKYVGSGGMTTAPRELPAQISQFLELKIKEICEQLALFLNIRGVVRIDFLSDLNEELYLNEINTVPGSLSRHLWADCGVDFMALINDLLNEATANAAEFSTFGADGSVLRAASNISSKLS